MKWIRHNKPLFSDTTFNSVQLKYFIVLNKFYIFDRFNAVVRRNEPSRHQHSHSDTSYGPLPSNSRDGYRATPLNSGYIPESGFPNPGHGNEHPSYPGSSGSFNSAVGFSVKHVMELKKDQLKPF